MIERLKSGSSNRWSRNCITWKIWSAIARPCGRSAWVTDRICSSPDRMIPWWFFGIGRVETSCRLSRGIPDRSTRSICSPRKKSPPDHTIKPLKSGIQSTANVSEQLMEIKLASSRLLSSISRYSFLVTMITRLKHGREWVRDAKLYLVSKKNSIAKIITAIW